MTVLGEKDRSARITQLKLPGKIPFGGIFLGTLYDYNVSFILPSIITCLSFFLCCIEMFGLILVLNGDFCASLQTSIAALQVNEE